MQGHQGVIQDFVHRIVLPLHTTWWRGSPWDLRTWHKSGNFVVQLSFSFLCNDPVVGTLPDVVASPSTSMTGVLGIVACLFSSSRCILRWGGSMLRGQNRSIWNCCSTFATEIPDLGFLKPWSWLLLAADLSPHRIQPVWPLHPPGDKLRCKYSFPHLFSLGFLWCTRISFQKQSPQLLCEAVYWLWSPLLPLMEFTCLYWLNGNRCKSV